MPLRNSRSDRLESTGFDEPPRFRRQVLLDENVEVKGHDLLPAGRSQASAPTGHVMVTYFRDI